MTTVGLGGLAAEWPSGGAGDGGVQSRDEGPGPLELLTQLLMLVSEMWPDRVSEAV